MVRAGVPSAGVSSALLASADRVTGAEGVLIWAELSALAVLTSDSHGRPSADRPSSWRSSSWRWSQAFRSWSALALFYAGVDTSLVHGWLAARSLIYARMSAGFYSAPLLGSFCIFASALPVARGRRHSEVARGAWDRSR